MAVSVAARDFSIVLVGDFNPAILHPSWFATQGLIKQGEALESNVEIVHKEVASWAIDWVKVLVNPERLQFTSEQEAYFEPVRDLALGMLALLEHTPIKAMGLNCGGYYQFSNRDSYDRFGHDLVPKQRWNSVLRDPRTLRVTITAPLQDGNDNMGTSNVTVSASNRFPFCVQIAANEHTDLVGIGTTPSSLIACKRIEAQWIGARKRFEDIVRVLTEDY